MEKDNKRLIDHGVRKAKETARESGLKIGQVVAHVSDPIVYALKEIKGEQGVVWIPGKPESTKTFPLSELFDPNDVSREAVSQKMRESLGALFEQDPTRLN